jgi:hypothetical protein
MHIAWGSCCAICLVIEVSVFLEGVVGVYFLLTGEREGKMPTRKIAELTQEELCTHPEHNPPQHMVFSPGTYEHECPACGKKTIFVVPLYSL